MSTTTDDERFDGMFLTMAQNLQGIEPLLDTLLSFLRRKTDFFTGAGPDQIEALIMKLVKKHSEINTKQINAKKSTSGNQESMKKKESNKPMNPKPVPTPAAKVVEEEDVLEMSSDGTFDASQTKVTTPVTSSSSSSSSTAAVVETKAATQEETTEEEDKNTSPSRKYFLKYHIVIIK
jgi:hypothetical protein